MPRFSVIVEFLVDAEEPEAARQRALDYATTGVSLQGMQGESCNLQAGDGDVVNMDEVESKKQQAFGFV